MTDLWIKFKSDTWDNSKDYVLSEREIFFIQDKGIWCIGDGVNPVSMCECLTTIPPVIHCVRNENNSYCTITAEEKLPTDEIIQ